MYVFQLQFSKASLQLIVLVVFNRTNCKYEGMQKGCSYMIETHSTYTQMDKVSEMIQFVFHMSQIFQ